MKILSKMAGMFMFLALGFTSCKEEVEIKNSLSVSPDTALEFNATGNESVTLTVNTDADKWTYTAPEWITTEQKENTLVVNVQDNTGEERNGSIEFSAGTADMVKINVLQHKSGDDGVEDGKIAGSIKDESEKNSVKVIFDNEIAKSTVNIKFTFTEALQSDARVSVFVDKEYIDQYNYENATSCILLPDNVLSAAEWPVTITAGSKEAKLSIEVDCSKLNYAANYLLPLKVKAIDGDVAFQNKNSRVNYIFFKHKDKDIKQMCIMEFNDANPLNVLEYKLADGSYFFDALVLFSGNMGWDAGTGTVRFNARTGEPVINGNTDALIKKWKTYIKPIHDAGIKVYMGIMPHHTKAGIVTLSQDGCKWFAEEMAQIVKDCYLDGVFLDEEYRGSDGGDMSPEWASPLITDGSYFAFQMSKQMDAICDWPTDVAVYKLGDLAVCDRWKTVTDHEDSSFKMTPDQYFDIVVADYGKIAAPAEGQTLKNCTGASLELNLGYYIEEEEAKKVKDDGYGWIMYFALNPDPNHGSYTEQATEVFQNAARGCYDQDLIPPTHYYKKLGEGEFDPERYPLN